MSLLPAAPRILTVTLNPSLDLATSAAEVRPGPKLRCEAPRVDPGGGGINVARAIRILGGSATAFVAAAGPTGERLLRLLEAERVQIAPFEGPGETRQSLAVTDRTTGGQYRLMLPGPVWTRARAAAALKAIVAAAAPGGFVILSGSQPPGLHEDFPARLARRLARRKARLILDTSGAPLHRAATLPGAPLFALRMDTEEAEELAGHKLPTRAASADFAHALVRSGVASMVIVARGADGSTLATEGQRLHASGVAVPVVSSVGAGDSFLGAFTLALAHGEEAGAALCKGSAAAASAVMTDATRLCTKAVAARLLKQVVLTEV